MAWSSPWAALAAFAVGAMAALGSVAMAQVTIAPVPAPAPVQAFVEIFGVTANLNVRAGPSADTALVGKVSNGMILRELQCQPVGRGRWCEIESISGPPLRGWASGNFMRPAAGPSGAAPGTTTAVTTLPAPSGTTPAAGFLEVFGVPGDGLNVRSGPSMTAEVIGVIRPGMALRDLGCEDGGAGRWCQIETTTEPRISGWASRRYLRPLTAALPPEIGGPAPAVPTGPPQGVKCNVDSNRCLQEAQRLCPLGSFQVLGSESHAGTLVSDATPGPVTWYVMTFQCGPADGRRPDFPFQGPALTGGSDASGGALVSGGTGRGASDPVPLENMQAFCRGVAAEQFMQRPIDILTLPVQLNQSTYQVHGQFPPTGGTVTLFTCQFDGDRAFLSIR